MSNEFYVHTDALKDVATQIQTLLDKVNNDDASKGTFTEFQKASSIDAPTATFWSGKNAFAEAYAHEYKYVMDTFAALNTQLSNVKTACTATAAKYETHETNAKNDVKSSDTELPG